MYDTLVSQFENKTTASLYMLQHKWYSITKDPGENLQSYVSKIKDLVTKMEGHGEKLSDNMIMTKIIINFTHKLSPFCYCMGFYCCS